jgi:hypothetical protein
MIIADSKDDNCIQRLMYHLEHSYPGIPFKMTIGYTSRIEVDDEDVNSWNDTNKNIFERIEAFCDGYTIGWDAATS